MMEREDGRKNGRRVTGPLIRGKGERGPRFPVDENPWDLIFDDERYIGIIRSQDEMDEEAKFKRES